MKDASIQAIYIKYTNEKKDNFNAYLSENGIYEFENNFFSYFYYHPDIIKNKIRFSSKLTNIDIKIKMKYELFNIGMTLYALYFNIIPFYKESDYLLYQDIVLNNMDIFSLKYDPLEYPLLEALKEKYKKRPEMFNKPLNQDPLLEPLKEKHKERREMFNKLLKRDPLLEPLKEKHKKGGEMFNKPIKQDPLLEPLKEKHKERGEMFNKPLKKDQGFLFFDSNFELEQIKKEELKEALILTLSERRNFWIKNLSHPHELFENKNLIFDNLLYDLIYKLIKYDSKENITNYDDFFGHPFFSQYQY